MVVLKNGTIISFSGNSVMIHGISPKGKMGIWVFPAEKRIFEMDNVIRIHKYSLKHLVGIVKQI